MFRFFGCCKYEMEFAISDFGGEGGGGVNASARLHTNVGNVTRASNTFAYKFSDFQCRMVSNVLTITMESSPKPPEEKENRSGERKKSRLDGGNTKNRMEKKNKPIHFYL